MLVIPYDMRYFHSMQIYIFRSQQNANLLGLTADKTGNHLPADLGPWITNGNGTPAIPTDEATSKAVVNAINSDGFYIVDTKIFFRESGF
jgi:hypothetical protein